jgi:hypothetical protein
LALRLAGWEGYAMMGDTYRLRQKLKKARL